MKYSRMNGRNIQSLREIMRSKYYYSQFSVLFCWEYDHLTITVQLLVEVIVLFVFRIFEVLLAKVMSENAWLQVNLGSEISSLQYSF